MNKSVLVTGGAGFIGSHTVDALIRKGYRVRILDSLAKPVHQFGKPDYLNKQAEFLLGDVRNKGDWLRALKDVDYIYHFAAYQDYLPNFSKYFDVNVKGTALMYEIIVEKNLSIKKVIVASSQAVYGEGKYTCQNGHTVFPSQRSMSDLKKKKWNFVCPYDSLSLEPQWAEENQPVYPHNSYGISKYAQEILAINLGKRYRIPTIALRYSIVQGEKQSPFNLYSGALRIFVTRLLAKKSPTIFEDGFQIRDFVNIHDVVSANLLVLENKKADYEVFNIGGGKKWTVNDFFDSVQSTLKSDSRPKRGTDFRIGDTRHNFSRIDKIKRIGFITKYTVEDSTRDYFQWIVHTAYLRNKNYGKS